MTDVTETPPPCRWETGVDIFRLEDGKIVEHWDVIRPIPTAPPTPIRCSEARAA